MKIYEYVIRVKDQFTQKLKALGGESDKAEAKIKNVAKASSGLSSVFKGLAIGMISAFSVGAISDFMGKVIQVRGEFQKYEAVLTNTLGSKSSAQRDMLMLQDLAGKTNFSLMEMTDSYVKMLNRGMKPTSKELINLSDLANSTGKGYDQLVEALLDAQTGEFERLKEFGVRAEKHGNKVKFTFKGVTKEVNFSSDAINKYILGLGELNGVSGSTEAISKTLTGQMSNLGDSFDRLFNVIGSRSDSVLGKAIGQFGQLINNISDLMMLEEEYVKKSLSSQISAKYKGFEDSFSQVAELAKKTNSDVEATLRKSWDAMSIPIMRDLEAVRSELEAFDKENKQGLFGTGIMSSIYGLPEDQERERNKLRNTVIYYEEKLQALGDAYDSAVGSANKPTSTSVGKAKKSIDDTIKGGAKATTVNISINKMIEKMAENMNFANAKEGAADVEQAILEALNRVINGAVYTARQ